jgi:sec-independent protein translocase protein TatA
METATFAYIGTPEILWVVGLVVLLFGGAKIPQLARGLGEGIREFKKSMDGTDEKEEKVAPPGPVAPEETTARTEGVSR